MKDLETVVKRFKKDGQPNRAKAVRAVMQMPLFLISVSLDSIGATKLTELAKDMHKTLKAKNKSKPTLDDCIVKCQEQYK